MGGKDMSVSSYLLRKLFTSGDNKRDAGLMTPADIQRFDDIPYGTDAQWQCLDVYRPKAIQGSLPVIVSVHGGGWVYGDKERYQFYCMDLARRGFAVVNFTYHLAPKYKFPQPLLDTCMAFQWVLDNADQYGLDTKNVFAVGDSAGGHLLALYCILCTNPDYAARYDFAANADALPKAVGLNCGSYDIAGSGLTHGLTKDFLPERGTPEELALITPLNHITKTFPPSYIMTASKDFLQEDSLKLQGKLNALGVPNTFRLYDNARHSLGHVFHLDIRSAEAKECNDEECRFFREHITG